MQGYTYRVAERSGGEMMKVARATRILAVNLGVAALCASAIPAMAVSFTQPGGTMGIPLGTSAPPGLYFSNSANWGEANNVAIDHTQAIGYEIPALVWSSGYTFLGASYSASVAGTFEEVGNTRTNYQAGVFNPSITPVALSWNLGHDFYISFQENVYIPISTNLSQPGAGFEQVVSISYTGNDWVVSANNIFGVTTSDNGGLKEPDYYNIDATIAHNFGAWQFGAVGYGSFDLETTAINAAVGRGTAIGVGGLLGYTFSNNIALTLMATHQVDTHGSTSYLKDDTRVWTSITIPIWNPPAAPAAKPLVAKY